MSFLKNAALADPIGPIWTGGFVDVQVKDDTGQDYTLLFLPDRNNDELRRAGKPMSFYYALDDPRLARDEDGHYKMHLQKFSAVMDPDTNIGADGYAEIAGGYLTFSTTMKVPELVMQKAIANLKQRLEGQYADHRLLGWQAAYKEPNIAPMPIVDNLTKVNRITVLDGDAEGENVNEQGNPNPWLFDVQGEGKGSLNPISSNAFSAMLGQYPVQLVEAGAKSGTSPIVINNHIRFKVWSMAREIRIRGNWEHIYRHFSADAKFKSWFTNVDVGVELNKMIKNGAISVEVKFDKEFVTLEDEENFNKAKDAVVQSFLNLAKETIFDVKMPEVEPAEAKSSGGLLGKWFGGSGFALKYRKDQINLSLDHYEKVDVMVIKDSKHSANLDGLFDELKNDSEAEERYFSQVYLEEGFKKIHVVASSNANWGDNNGNPGDPIHRITLQVGYPDSEGNITWKNTARYKSSAEDGDLSKQGALASWSHNTKDRIYVFDFTRHDDMGDDSDKVYLKKTVSYQESPNVFVEEVTKEGLTNDHIVEVRSDSANKLEIGPIDLDMMLPGDQVKVLVSFDIDGLKERKLSFNGKDLGQQYLEFWYVRPEDVPDWRYKAEVIVKGKNFWDRPVRWESDWTPGEGNGPLTVELPEIPEEQMEKVISYLS